MPPPTDRICVGILQVGEERSGGGAGLRAWRQSVAQLRRSPSCQQPNSYVVLPLPFNKYVFIVVFIILLFVFFLVFIFWFIHF